MTGSDRASATPDVRELARCDRLVVGYRGRGLLPPLDLTIARGTFLVVIGRNGAGKSTWLKTMLGLIPPVSGRVELARGGGPDEAIQLSYVPQNIGLDELLPIKAGAIVRWGRQRGWSFLRPFASAADRRATREALAEADATDLASMPFRELSGGQRQRILFARLLASGADLALLDEPTASMDASVGKHAYDKLAELARQRDIGVVVVTHTLSAAARYANQVLFLDRGDGSDGEYPDGVVEWGAPETVLAHPLFKRHFGHVNLAGPA